MLRTSLALALPLFVIGATQAGGCGGSGSNPTADACGDYFDALLPCIVRPGIRVDLAHYRARSLEECERLLALPGSSFTVAHLRECAKAATGLDCGAIMAAPACLEQPGDLEDGATCVISAQCKSAVCVPEPNTFCGTCRSASAAGQPCDGYMTACVPGTACSGGTCTRITYGAVGASCGSYPQFCDTGLYCDDSVIPACVPRKGADDACASDFECASGFLCDDATLTCVETMVAAAGEKCGGAVICEAGLCPWTGICPTVITDGQPCDPSVSAVCDLFATCSQGICQPNTSACM